jgi:CRISPR system Cascade subunit CasE
MGVRGWLSSADSAIDLAARLTSDSLTVGQRFRFRLRANPAVTRNGKRLGLLSLNEQEQWLVRKGEQHGFVVPCLTGVSGPESSRGRLAVRVSQEQMLRGKQHTGNAVSIFSVLYDGILTVDDPTKFRHALRTGIGHGKVMGLGLLSVAPMSQRDWGIVLS